MSWAGRNTCLWIYIYLYIIYIYRTYIYSQKKILQNVDLKLPEGKQKSSIIDVWQGSKYASEYWPDICSNLKKDERSMSCEILQCFLLN